MKTHRMVVQTSALLLLGIVILVIVVGLPGAVAQNGGHPEHDGAAIAEQHRRDQALRLIGDAYEIQSRPIGADSLLSFTCTSEAVLTDPSVAAPSINRLTVRMNDRRVMMTGDAFIMERDETTLLYVLPEEQRIYLYDVNRESDGGRTATDPMMAFRRDLFDACSVVALRDSSDRAGVDLLVATLSPDPATQRTSGVREMEVVVDRAGRSVRRVAYTPTHPDLYSRLSWTFESMERIAVPPSFNRPITDAVLTEAGELRGEYAGYVLEENEAVSDDLLSE